MTAKAIAEMVNIISKKNSNRTITYDGHNLNEMKSDNCCGAVVAGGDLQHVLEQEMANPQMVADFWNIVLNKENAVFARVSNLHLLTYPFDSICFNIRQAHNKNCSLFLLYKNEVVLLQLLVMVLMYVDRYI